MWRVRHVSNIAQMKYLKNVVSPVASNKFRTGYIYNQKLLSRKIPTLHVRHINNNSSPIIMHPENKNNTKRFVTKLKHWKFTLIGSAIGFAIAGYLYLTPEKQLMKSILKRFNHAYNYTAKLHIYLNVPEPRMSLPTNSSETNRLTINQWANAVNEISRELNNSRLFKIVAYMKETLIGYVNTNIPVISSRLKELRTIIPNSFDLYLETELQLNNELLRNDWLPTNLLKDNNVNKNMTY